MQRLDPSPHKSEHVNFSDIRLHYLEWGGSGPALLFLAGMGCNAHIFDDFAPRFTGHFRVLALTRRGHLQSDHPAGGYDIDTLTEDIRRNVPHARIIEIPHGHHYCFIQQGELVFTEMLKFLLETLS